MAIVAKFHFRKHIYLLTFKIGISLFCLFFLVVFCLLGTWQLHRYQFKKKLLATYQQQIQAAPKSFLEISKSKQFSQFQTVILKGHYLNDLTLFMQNRIYKGQVGFEVFTPFQMNGEKKLLLIDRGWISQSASPLDNIIGELQITGYIKLINEYQFILGKNILNPQQKPITAQKIDIDEISQITHHEFYPFILRLDPSQPHGFIRDWIISASPPERHLGYAVQWFSMAIVLLIAYLSFSITRQKNNESAHAK